MLGPGVFAIARVLWRPICLGVYNATMVRWLSFALAALLVSAAAPVHTLLIERAGRPPKELSLEQIAALKSSADGWTATFGLAELSPEFAGKPIQLADRMDGAPMSGQGLRLIVPNEHRGGRSVRDVVRIDIQ